MATGDLKGSLRKLQTSLRSIRYPSDVDYQGLAKGDPSSCLPIVSYTFCSFSSSVAELLMEHGVELTGKNDLSFIESVYKVLRDLFRYKPLLTKQQFLQVGFAERKVTLLCEMIGFVLEKHKQLTKLTKPASPLRRRVLSRNDSKTVQATPPKERERPRGQSQKVIRTGPLVVRHLSHSISAQASFCSDDQDNDIDEEKGRSPCDGDAPQPALHTCVSECSLRSVAAGLQECVSRLQEQLSVLNARVNVLEKNTAGKICIELGEWEELQNRVLLLETGLELSHAKGSVRSVEKSQHSEDTELEAHSSRDVTASIPSASGENIKERLKRIACMMKDTSSLLNTEPTI